MLLVSHKHFLVPITWIIIIIIIITIIIIIIIIIVISIITTTIIVVVVAVPYLTSDKIQLNDKADYQSNSLQLVFLHRIKCPRFSPILICYSSTLQQQRPISFEEYSGRSSRPKPTAETNILQIYIYTHRNSKKQHFWIRLSW